MKIQLSNFIVIFGIVINSPIYAQSNISIKEVKESAENLAKGFGDGAAGIQAMNMRKDQGNFNQNRDIAQGAAWTFGFATGGIAAGAGTAATAQASTAAIVGAAGGAAVGTLADNLVGKVYEYKAGKALENAQGMREAAFRSKDVNEQRRFETEAAKLEASASIYLQYNANAGSIIDQYKKNITVIYDKIPADLKEAYIAGVITGYTANKAGSVLAGSSVAAAGVGEMAYKRGTDTYGLEKTAPDKAVDLLRTPSKSNNDTPSNEVTGQIPSLPTQQDSKSNNYSEGAFSKPLDYTDRSSALTGPIGVSSQRLADELNTIESLRRKYNAFEDASNYWIKITADQNSSNKEKQTAYDEMLNAANRYQYDKLILAQLRGNTNDSGPSAESESNYGGVEERYYQSSSTEELNTYQAEYFLDEYGTPFFYSQYSGYDLIQPDGNTAADSYYVDPLSYATYSDSGLSYQSYLQSLVASDLMYGELGRTGSGDQQAITSLVSAAGADAPPGSWTGSWGFNVSSVYQPDLSGFTLQGFTTAAGGMFWGMKGSTHVAYGIDATGTTPSSGIFGFTRVGGTTPTDTLGRTGTVTTPGTLSVNFGTGNLTFSGLVYSIGGINYQFGAATFAPHGFVNIPLAVSGLGSCSTGGFTCTGAINGVLLGNGGTGAAVGVGAVGVINGLAGTGQAISSSTVQVYKR